MNNQLGQRRERAEDHPLYKPLMAAIHQAMFGKGVRHGCYTKCPTCGARFFTKIEPFQRGQRRS